MAQVLFGGADIFRLLYFINSKVPSGNPAFWGLRYRFFPFSSELRFRFFRTLPALMPSLYFAKFAFSEMLPTSNTIPHAPYFVKALFCPVHHHANSAPLLWAPPSRGGSHRNPTTARSRQAAESPPAPKAQRPRGPPACTLTARPNDGHAARCAQRRDL